VDGQGQEAIILVVGHDESVRRSIQDILAPEGLFCRPVSSGTLALEVAQQVQPGVVLLETRLPDANSLDLLTSLVRDSPGCQVILLSNPEDHELILDGLERGARDYLAKPLHPRETQLAVKRAIDAWRFRRDGNRLRQGVKEIAERWEILAARLAASREEERTLTLAEGVVEATTAALGAGKVSLMLLDEPGNWLRVKACAGHSVSPAEMDVVLPGEGVAGFALTAREPLVVADASADHRVRHMVVPDRYRSDSFALAPLVAEGRPFGVLCASESLTGQPFGEEALVLLRLLAQQFNSACLPSGDDSHRTLTSVDRAEPIAVAPLAESWLDTLEVLPKEEIEKAVDRDAGLAQEICRAVTDELDPERVIARALGVLRDTFPADLVSLYLADPNSNELKREQMTGGPGMADQVRLPLAQGLTGRAVETGAALLQMALERDSRFDREVDTPLEGHAHALLCIPISFRGRVIGVVRAFLSDGAMLSAGTGEVASAALSAAVRNVLLYRSLVASIEELAAARREGSG
jgi:DNA-binding response OmpR family regulator/putative methionine-R-sulfoxide reductase with GAF domain